MYWWTWVLFIVGIYLLGGIIFDIWFCIQKNEDYRVSWQDLAAGLTGWPVIILVKGALNSKGGGWF